MAKTMLTAKSMIYLSKARGSDSTFCGIFKNIFKLLEW